MTTPGHQIPGSDPVVDHKAAVAALRLRFPRIMIWYGTHTGQYWAMVANRFIKAETADALGRQLEASFLPPRRP